MSQPGKKLILSSKRLPYDVVSDILTRLPVKSIIRFRCVSKSYNSIITNPIFITTHFNLNRTKSLLSNNNNTHNGYLHYTPPTPTPTPTDYYYSTLKELCTVVCNRDHTLTLISSSEIPFFNDCAFCFCNGMVCIASHDEDFIEILYLWNPSIRKFKMLTATPLTRRFASLTHGLAYHSQNNDFKILRLICYGENGPTAEAEIYTLSTDSWRKVVLSEPDIGSIEEMLQSPFLFFNGALHNLAYPQDLHNCFILSFDVNDERFRKIMLPQNYYVGFTPAVQQLVVFKGLLALTAFGTNLNDIGKCHIWVMREYGVAESWTKKAVSTDWIDNFYGCTDNGELLIQNATGLVLFDPESLNENVLAIDDFNWVDYTANSMESLVLVNDVSSVDND